MKHKLFLLAIPLIAGGVCSCSDNDQPEVNTAKGEIRFNVTVPKATRAATTSLSINQFRIFSFVNQNPYMHNVSAQKVDGSWTTTPVMYWPADNAPVNFYCISPMIGEYSKTVIPTPNIEDYENVDGKTDLLYAVTKDATTSPVSINFRHALSKIAFNFKRREGSNQHAKLRIEVKEVTLTNIKSEGSFTFPTESTFAESQSAGYWHDQEDMEDVTVFKNGSAILTDDYTTLNNTGYEFAIPQYIADSKADLSGAYVKVLCSIADEESGVKIWPNGDNYSYLYFPLNSTGATNTKAKWVEGKAYAYNITVGVPYNVDKIEFSVSVDEYTSFENMYLE